MKIFKKIWSAVTTILVVIVVLAAVLMVGVRIAGIQTYTVLSGSMEPTFHVGSLVYVKSVDTAELKVGDPITYMASEDTVVTHRIAGIVPDEEDSSVTRFRTKGDANEAEDAVLVHYKNIIGKVIFNVPYLGYLANFIQSPKGRYVAIAAGAFLLVLVFVPDLIFKDEEPGKKPEDKKEEEEGMAN